MGRMLENFRDVDMEQAGLSEHIPKKHLRNAQTPAKKP